MSGGACIITKKFPYPPPDFPKDTRQLLKSELIFWAHHPEIPLDHLLDRLVKLLDRRNN